MKNVVICVAVEISNGEWQNRIVKEFKLDHSISLDLLNDENVFNSVMSLLKHRMSSGLDAAVNSVMQQMIDSDDVDEGKDEGVSENAKTMESGNA